MDSRSPLIHWTSPMDVICGVWGIQPLRYHLQMVDFSIAIFVSWRSWRSMTSFNWAGLKYLKFFDPCFWDGSILHIKYQKCLQVTYYSTCPTNLGMTKILRVPHPVGCLAIPSCVELHRLLEHQGIGPAVRNGVILGADANVETPLAWLFEKVAKIEKIERWLKSSLGWFTGKSTGNCGFYPKYREALQFLPFPAEFPLS